MRLLPKRISCHYFKLPEHALRRLAVLVVAFLFLCQPTSMLKSEERKSRGSMPNIVLIFIDDMGYGDIGPFGSTRNKTPQLDRMANEGMRFTDFYVSSTVCTPSRAALMTGCYAARVGMDGGVCYPAKARGLNPDEITVAEILKSKGYATGCFGKWHLGDQPEFMPLKQGFDEYVGIPYSNDMWPHHPKLKMPALPLVKGDKAVANVADGKSQALLCDVVTDAAVDFIKRHSRQPFFAYVPYSYVHWPRFTLKSRAQKAEGDVTRAQIEEVDSSVGRILDTLRGLGLAKNTLVIFTSDNGGAEGNSMGPLRGNKYSPKYEGHMRVPMLVWWPGKIPAGSVTREIAATIDILPTFASLADAKVPQDRVIDGKDISSLLFANPGAKSPHELHFYETEGVRRGQWKLLLLPKGKTRLYDLAADIGERKDLHENYPQRVAEMKSLLHAHSQEIKNHQRPAAFAKNPKPLLAATNDLPTLVEYMGFSGIEVKQGEMPAKKRK